MSGLFHVCSSLNKSSLLKPSPELCELSVESVINPLWGASEEKTHNRLIWVKNVFPDPLMGKHRSNWGWLPGVHLPIELVKKSALDLRHLLPGALEPSLQVYVSHESVMEETSLHRLNGCRCWQTRTERTGKCVCVWGGGANLWCCAAAI